ncbi:MAG: hypothetical protein P4L36_11750 [Holophaga sp.]|nr:hypothetical protein [Holophaga sp.]
MAGSLVLAVTRVYQVDEAQTVYMASVLARGWTKVLYTSGQLHLFPLSWLVRPGMDSAQLFMVFRIAFWALFWVNAALAVVAAGLNLRTSAGLKALVAVGSLAPWWAYGLEIRHDNVLLTGVMLLWILGRRVPSRCRTLVFFLLGVVALLLHACLFKSVATWVPLCALLLVLEPGTWREKTRLGACWAVGALAAWAFAFGMNGWAGLTGNLQEGPAALNMVRSVARFPPWRTLQMLLATAPLLTAALLGLIGHGVLSAVRQGVFAAWRDAEGFPETVLFLVCTLAFFLNPTPFPYNLAVLSGAGMVALLAVGKPWLEPGALKDLRGLPFLVAMVLVLHILPLFNRLTQLFSLTNDRQEYVMGMAEAFSAPGDPVFDTIGLVPTRKAPSFGWLINLTNVESFDRVSMTQSWGTQVPVVILPSYRLSYLRPVDMAFITANYVALRKDFWVLGRSWTKGRTEDAWTCLRTGRYAIIPDQPGNPGLELDGKPLAPGIYPIQEGKHTLRLAPDRPCWVAWVGPTLAEAPQMLTEGASSVCPVPGDF